LSDDAFDEVYTSLLQAPRDVASQKELAAQVSALVTKTDAKEIRNIVEVLTSLRQLRSRTNASAEKVARDVYDALQAEEGSPGLGERADQLKVRLGKSLALETLDILTSKAKELQTDAERIFCEARILTDLRPVFGQEVDSPKAMIVVHALKLAYHDGATGRLEEIFVALDDEDVRRLKLVAERAERKSKSLLSRLEAAGIKTIDPSQEEKQ
jgi:hypothetical protein